MKSLDQPAFVEDSFISAISNRLMTSSNSALVTSKSLEAQLISFSRSLTKKYSTEPGEALHINRLLALVITTRLNTNVHTRTFIVIEKAISRIIVHKELSIRLRFTFVHNAAIKVKLADKTMCLIYISLQF